MSPTFQLLICLPFLAITIWLLVSNWPKLSIRARWILVAQTIFNVLLLTTYCFFSKPLGIKGFAAIGGVGLIVFILFVCWAKFRFSDVPPTL